MKHNLLSRLCSCNISSLPGTSHVLKDYMAFFDNAAVGNFTGDLMIGVMELAQDDVNRYTSFSEIDPPSVPTNFSVPYNITPYTTGCFMQDDSTDGSWSDNGMLVSVTTVREKHPNLLNICK